MLRMQSELSIPPHSMKLKISVFLKKNFVIVLKMVVVIINFLVEIIYHD